MRILLLIGDLLVIVGVFAGAYFLYKKLFGPKKSEQEIKQYEQGFHDAVLYFGLEELYKNDQNLQSKLEHSFEVAGISCDEHFCRRRERVFD
jgi:hypothetical protein